MTLVAFIFIALSAYLLVGIVQLIFAYIPWMYDDAERSGQPPSVYQHVALQAAFLWPRDAYHDIVFVVRRRRERGYW